jgi:hypothetical protein
MNLPIIVKLPSLNLVGAGDFCFVKNTVEYNEYIEMQFPSRERKLCSFQIGEVFLHGLDFKVRSRKFVLAS